jgi:hypothetical protein
LHRLFIYEPQWNQHPAVSAPWLAAVLHPLLQMAVMAPALLLAAPKEVCPRRLRLEWAAVLLASLAISTSPASYLFTLLILPVCLVWEALQRREDGLLLAALLFLYLAAGFPGWTTAGGDRVARFARSAKALRADSSVSAHLYALTQATAGGGADVRPTHVGSWTQRDPDIEYRGGSSPSARAI